MEIELEKKWVLKELPDLTKHGFELVKAEKFVQSYLDENKRLRMISKPGSRVKTYQSFTKTSTGVGAAVEDKKELTEAEYTKALKKAKRQLTKVRTTYKGESGLLYEVDHLKFAKPRVDVLLMEVEFQELYKDMEEVDQVFSLDDSIFGKYILQDVTGNKAYSNYSLADLLK